MTAVIPAGPEQRFPCKVYYEDTDCGGVVYHANYLKFMERARTEYLAAFGTTVSQWAEKGLTFMVYRVDITFRAPARLGDELVVISRPRPSSPFRTTFEQRVELAKQEAKPLVQAEVEIVCIDPKGTLQPFPAISW